MSVFDLFVFIIASSSYVFCQTFNLEGILPYSTIEADYVFYCNLTNGGFPSAAQTIRFLRHGEAMCNVDIKTCLQYKSHTSRYSCGCVHNDNTRMLMNISDVNTEDEDDWSCGFRFYSGLKSVAKRLSLYYGPGSSITFFPATSRSHTVNEGNSLSPITCTATCKPDCSISWFRDVDLSVAISNHSVLYLTNVIKQDEGKYICLASNIIDTNTSSISVYVHAKQLPELNESNLTFGVGVGVGIVICAIVMVTGMLTGIYCYRKSKLNNKNWYDSTQRERTYTAPVYDVPHQTKSSFPHELRPDSYDHGLLLSQL